MSLIPQALVNDAFKESHTLKGKESAFDEIEFMRRCVRKEGIQNSEFKIQYPEICPCRAVTLCQPHEGPCLLNDDGMGIPPAVQAEWRGDTFRGKGAARA